MSKQKIFLFVFLFIFSNIKKTNQSDLSFSVPESSFMPLNSREIKLFELSPDNSEIYYSFQNDYSNTDIIINLKVAKGFTTYCYIYDSYEKIEIDSQGEYINAMAEFSMTEKSIILKSSVYSIKSNKYYIVIKDILKSYNKDYISIFNELDNINLENEQYINIDKFYSENMFIFTFSHKKEEVVTLELNTNNIYFYQEILIYYSVSEAEEELIYDGEKNKGEIKINEDLESEGSYRVYIVSEEEPYLDIKSSIILHKDDKNVKELKYKDPLVFAYTGNKIFNFFADIDDYDFNDENIVTFKFGDQVFNRNLLSHCYAKVMNFESYDDNKLMANMPANEDENEAVFTRISGTTGLYQLYFKKTLEKEENKKSYLLIHLSLKIEEHDTDEYISPEEFTVFLSDKPLKIKLEEYNNNIILNKNIKLENYIPQIYKIVLPKKEENNAKLSYIFYTSDNIQNIYNNTMISNDNHLNENSKMIYAISPYFDGYDYTNTLYIKLYGYNDKEINFRIESTESSIYYINNEYRKIRTFSDKITNCNKSFYYIGDYGFLVEKGYIFNEILYGKINLFYKGVINSEDKTILINEDSKYLIDNNLVSLDTSIDIIELKCETPGFYQSHLMDNVEKRDINLYSRIYNYLPKNKNFTISPVLSPIQEDINFEIYNPKGKEIKISDGEKITTLDSNNKYYQVKYKNYSQVPTSFTVLSAEDTVISITLTNQDPFVIVEKETTHVDYDSQIIVKLPQNKKYESVNIVITRIYHGYSYSLFKGNVDFASKLIESEYDYITIDRSHKINMTISNPYLRDEQALSGNNVYYIMYSIDDPEMIQKDVILSYNDIKEYEKIENGKSKIIFTDNEKYSLPFGKDINSLNVIYLSCANSLKEINIYNYNDEIETIRNSKNESSYQCGKIDKKEEMEYQIGINLNENSIENMKINGAVIGITNQDISEEDIKKYSERKLKINQKGKKIEWDKYDNIKQYDIFVLDENNTYTQYLKNPCLLQSIKNNITTILINNNDSYIKYYSSNTNSIKMEEKGRYAVTVSVNIEGKVPLIYIYDSIIYDSSSEAPEDDDKGGKGTIIFLAIALPLVIIIVIALLIFLIKYKKNQKIDLEEPKEERLVRETTQSEQSQE